MSDTITVQGQSFTLASLYAAGHVCNENEAYTLNQTRAENIRNNFAKTVKEALGTESELSDEAKTDLQAKLTSYASEYEFNGRRAGRAPVDPTEREARKMAKGLVLAALRSKEIDVDTLPEGKLDELIDGALSKRPDIREEAKRRIAAAKSLAQEVLSDEDVAA